MATSRKEERRLLSKDELELVERTHQPQLAGLAADELSPLIARLRERRDRARDIAHSQRRQVRGKAGGRKAGASDAPEHKDSGNRRKAAILTEALFRLTAERNRRTARDRLVASARKALALKKKAGPRSEPPKSRSAGKGMRPNPKTRVDQIGSAMEAGRVSQFVRDAQAKRDAR